MAAALVAGIPDPDHPEVSNLSFERRGLPPLVSFREDG